MANDRDSADIRPEHEAELPDQNSSYSSVTRREVLIGSASALVASQALAATQNIASLDVSYEDATRRGLVITWGEKPAPGKQRVPATVKDRSEWRLRASSFTEPDVPNGRGQFVLRRTREGWRAEIARCVLPGGYEFGLKIEVTWDPRYGEIVTPPPEKPTLTITLKRPDGDIRLFHNDLIAFLQLGQSPDKNSSDLGEIPGPLSKSQTSSLAQKLFGDSFETTNAKAVSLAFHHGGYWILRAGRKTVSEPQQLGEERKNRFSALSRETVSLGFKEVFFTVFSGNSGGQDADAAFLLDPRPANKDKDKEKEDVRALFAGDGAPPAPENSLSKSDGTTLTIDEAPVRADTGRTTPNAKAPSRRAAFEAASLAAEKQALAPRVLYALVRHDEAKNLLDDKWSGSVSLGSGPGGESATLTLYDGAGPGYLGWRNSGDRNPVFALRARMSLAVLRKASATKTEFRELNGQLWRANGGDKLLRLIASLTPTLRPMELDTRFGPFTTAPLPALSPRPGIPARLPTIRVGGSGPRATRKLNHFAAPLALERAAIPLASDRFSQIEAQNGIPSKDRALQFATLPFSQLTFHETECLFRINKLPLRHAWIGTPAPSTDPPQAEGIVHIGATKEVGLPVQLSLSRARLMVRRPADLLALTYRFQDLLLERGDFGWRVTPDRRMAAFLPNGQPLPDPTAPLVCLDKPALANEPTRYQNRADPRPLLAVEFPPQHIAERAFLRQLRPDPALPMPPPGKAVSDPDAVVLRFGPLLERLRLRSDISKKQLDGLIPTDPFRVFVEGFPGAIDQENSNGGGNRKIPDDQKIYIGPDFLDPESARVARRIARNNEDSDPDQNALRARVFGSLPDVALAPLVIADLRKGFPIDPLASESSLEDKAADPDSVNDPIRNYLTAREKERRLRDPDYGLFASFYESPAPALLRPFRGPRNAVARVARLSSADQTPVIAAVLAIVNAFDRKLREETDRFVIPAEARVSGSSRLVFRVPADDFEGGRPDNRQDAPAGAFPFTIEALTNWGAFDLAVVRRAEKVFEPLPGWASPAGEQIANGRLPPRWARQETRDEATKLLHQGLTRGDAWAVRYDEQRVLQGVANCPRPLARLGAVTAAQRMSEIASSVRPPSLYETSIELPFRLMLSPAQDAVWRTPVVLDPELKLSSSASLPVPLWFAQLDEAPGSSSLRAIWSPDFRPEALLELDVGGPPHGPWAPWAMPRSVTARKPYEENEPVWPFPNDPNTPKPPERFRTGLDVADRHELVALTSVYGLPVRGRRKTNGTLTDGSQINPPAGFKLRRAGLEKLDPNNQAEQPDDYSAIYKPQSLNASELTLTALGGSFDADTNFVPPASAKIVPQRDWDNGTRGPGNPLFDAFSIERWRQDTRLGRDIRAEVVYKGFLFPFGHRASLVKLTERRFVAGPGGVAKGPVAFLIQRFFLRIGTPLKTYPAIGQPNGGRSWPTERLEILTRVTPDLIDPADATTAGTVTTETQSGRIFLFDNNNACPGLVFWPRVRRGRGGEVNFELQVDGRGARTRLPLIFVDNTAANDVPAMRALKKYYSELELNRDVDPRRILDHGGSKRRYAAEKEPDDTSFETRFWVIGAEGRENSQVGVGPTDRTFTFDNSLYDFGALLQGADQPPFYPVMQNATVRIGQVDRILGKLGKGNNPTTDIVVRFDDEYKAFGFPPDDRLATAPSNVLLERAAKTDVYLDFDTAVQLDPGRDGERTGGPVRPNTPLVAMSRSRGPVGNHKDTSLTGRVVALAGPRSNGLDNPQPGTFFDVDAKILGILPLGQALSFIGAGLSSAPQFNEVTHYTSALLTEAQNEEAGAAVAKVRDRLLIPLRDALRTLARQYYDAVKDPQNPGEFIEEDALARIERLYPDVGKSYRELAEALDNAIATSATARDLDALLVAFGAIYGTGRRFLAAIERVANDPLAPVHAALLEAFNTKIAELIASIEGVLGPILSGLRSALDKAKTDLYDNLAKLISDPDFTVWRRIVFALPGSYSISDTTLATAVDDEVAGALVQAAAKSGFLVVLASGNLQQAADAIGQEFEKEFDARVSAAATGSPLKGALIEAQKDWKAASDDAAERIKGLLYTTASTEIAALLTAMGQLSDRNQKTISALVGALQQAAAAAIGAVQPVIDFDLSVAARICNGVVTVVATLFDEVSPPDSFIQQVRTAKTDMNTAFEAAKTALTNFGLQQEAEDIRKELDDKLAALGEVQNAVSHAKGKLTRLAAEVCQINNPAHLPLAAFAALARTRDTLEADVNKFQRALASPLRNQSPLQALLAKIPDTTQPGKDARTALANAAKAAGKASEVLGQLARDATSLRSGNPLQNTVAALTTLKTGIGNAEFSTRVDALIAIINAASARFTALKNEIQSEINALGLVVQQTVTNATDAKAYVDSLIAAVGAFPHTIDDIVGDVVDKVEQKLLQEIAKYIIDGAPYVNQMILIAMDGLGVVFKVLASAQVAVVNARKTAWVALGGKPGGAGPNPAPGGIGDDLSSITLERVLALLFILPVPTRDGLQTPPANPDPTEVDYLAAERNELTALAGKFGTAANFDKATFTAVKALLDEWKKGNGSAQLLAKNLGDAAAAVLSGDLKRIVDLEGARRRIEEKLKELVPSKIVLDYGIKAELKALEPIFLPHAGSQISLSAGATFDFLDVNAPPRYKATCQIDPFDINLFDVVTLMFNGAEFVSENGKGSDFNISYKDFELGPKAAFLQPLQSLMNPGGDGPYVRLASGFPGIEAGYTLDLGIISIGTLSFINVSISASCILPFDKQDAIFTVAIGQKERPVMLSCLPYTGGGFLKLYANAQKMRGFEASFEFGGGGAFGFGPLTGQGRICTGIYLRQFDNSVTIEGYFYAGGEAHIACFAISATLVVRISMLPSGTMQGSAVFTFSFSIGFAKLRYSVGVQRQIGKGFSGSRSVAFAEEIFELADMTGKADAPAAVVTSNAVAQQENWVVYQTYFANDINGFPKWQ